MPASGEAYGDTSTATMDTWVDENGKEVTRVKPVAKKIGQLSGLAFGDSPEKGFERRAAPEHPHDYNPDK